MYRSRGGQGSVLPADAWKVIDGRLEVDCQPRQPNPPQSAEMRIECNHLLIGLRSNSNAFAYFDSVCINA